MIAVLAALLLQQPAPEPAVTVRKKTATWTFAFAPEGRAKVQDGARVKEIDVPARLYVAWTGGEPEKPGTSPFTPPPSTSGKLDLPFPRADKDYGGADYEFIAREMRVEIEEALATSFVEFDLDFPGGSWDDLAKVLQEKVSAAWPEQLPEILKAHFPARLDISVLSRPGYVVRYPAIQAKSVSLARLRAFGLAPELEARTEAVSKVHKDPAQGPYLDVEERKTSGRLQLSDGNRHRGETEMLQIAFFNLVDKGVKLPRPEDVVALFELAWKARGGPVFARVKYHPETQTLLLQATPEEVQAAQAAFASLVGRPAPADPSRNPFDALNENLKSIEQLLRERAEKKDK